VSTCLAFADGHPDPSTWASRACLGAAWWPKRMFRSDRVAEPKGADEVVPPTSTLGIAGKPSRPVNNRRRTSRSRFATADPLRRVRESHPGAGRAANGTRTCRRAHPPVRRPPHEGLDRVGRSTKLVCGDMRHHGCLAGSVCGVASGSGQLSGRSHGMAPRRSALGHPDLAARPGPNLRDRLAGPRVGGLHRLEEVHNVLRACGSPPSQEPMVGVGKRPPTADGDEAGIAIVGQDHGGNAAALGEIGETRNGWSGVPSEGVGR